MFKNVDTLKWQDGDIFINTRHFMYQLKTSLRFELVQILS